MNVLITDAGFNLLGGAERAARDLAVALVERGHRVAAFSTPIGDRAWSVADLGLPTVWSLDDLTFRPDVIHGQHHLDAMTAIVGLPGVPALYHCHGAAFFDAVPLHPRIRRYVAVSTTLSQRIAAESGIPEADISVVLNSVDLRRFTTVREPATEPARVALFGNQIARNALAESIGTVAGRRGLQVDFVGRSFGNEIGSPETILPGYDIVFASGKSALDAIACGCAVIIIGFQGCGDMVVPENFERLRQVNFTIPFNSTRPDEGRIEAALEQYSPAAVREVTLRLRATASLDGFVDTFEELYRTVIDRHCAAPADPRAEQAATANYLRSLAALARAVNEGGVQTAEARASRTLGLLARCTAPSTLGEPITRCVSS